MITFGHENLHVSDLEAAIRFYEDKFRLTVCNRIDGSVGKMAWLTYAGTDFFLELTEGEVVKSNDHICFVTDDPAFHALHAEAGLIDEELGQTGIYFMHDPDGNSIEVMPALALKAFYAQGTK